MAKAMGEDTDSLPENERPAAFITALLKMQKACGVDQLKLSEYGIEESQIPGIAANAWDTMGGLFDVDPSQLSMKDTEEIIKKAYR